MNNTLEIRLSANLLLVGRSRMGRYSSIVLIFLCSVLKCSILSSMLLLKYNNSYLYSIYWSYYSIISDSRDSMDWIFMYCYLYIAIPLSIYKIFIDLITFNISLQLSSSYYFEHSYIQSSIIENHENGLWSSRIIVYYYVSTIDIKALYIILLMQN